MNYDAEVAAKPLTGNRYDLLILQEREQRLLIGANGRRNSIVIPAAQYCELSDMYKKLLREREAVPEPSGEMSVEQAVAILNPETSREALAAYEYYGGFHGREAGVKACEEACRVAVQIMRNHLAEEGKTEETANV